MLNSLIRKVEKVPRKISTIIETKINEKVYHNRNSDLRYMFFRSEQSENLAVIFSSYTPTGARYNYIRTLDGLEINKLYIKDDFASNKTGNYYIGQNRKYNVEKAVYELIDEHISLLQAKKIFFIGSSKGGYAAINFGVSYPNASILVASPQYHLGDYLNNKEHMPNLVDILGEVDSKGVDELNNRLATKIRKIQHGESLNIYIHYSTNEHTYREHIMDMLEDLEYIGCNINRDIKSYQNHHDLALYFPNYLLSHLKLNDIQCH